MNELPRGRLPAGWHFNTRMTLRYAHRGDRDIEQVANASGR